MTIVILMPARNVSHGRLEVVIHFPSSVLRPFMSIWSDLTIIEFCQLWYDVPNFNLINLGASNSSIARTKTKPLSNHQRYHLSLTHEPELSSHAALACPPPFHLEKSPFPSLIPALFLRFPSPQEMQKEEIPDLTNPVARTSQTHNYLKNIIIKTNKINN